ncbi:phage tail assembly protein T [Escherichia coli]|nr:phage tail assembly protein T [Escherichia coli]HBB1429843.1 phage tail assembly protein T [Escherichia coli]HBB1658417.1 phage tail assembly protein T [Escherichia coli]
MFDGELSFALKLAREMGRPDWRAMLAGMSSTEYADWHRFYSTHYFHDVLLDMHFSGLTYTVLSLFFSDPDIGAHTHSVAIGSHGHTITVNAAGNAENTVKNIAFNYIVRLA